MSEHVRCASSIQAFEPLGSNGAHCIVTAGRLSFIVPSADKAPASSHLCPKQKTVGRTGGEGVGSRTRPSDLQSGEKLQCKGGLRVARRPQGMGQKTKGRPRASGARTARKEVNIRTGSVPNGREGEVTRPGWRRGRVRRRCGHRRDRRSGRSCTCRCRPSRQRRTGWGQSRCCC